MKKHLYTIAFFTLSLFLLSCVTKPKETNTKKTIQEMILSGETEEAKVFFQLKSDVNAIDNDGNTVLHAAAIIDDADLVTFFIHKGAHTALKNFSGDTPLHTAIKNKSIQAAKIIATADGAIFSRDGDGKSALYLGLENDALFYDALISTKTGQMRDSKNRSLIHYIVEKEDTKALSFAISKKIPLSVVDDDGISPLDIAYGKTDSVESVKIASMLLLAGAKPLRDSFSYFEDAVILRSISMRFEDGQTPLHLASIFGHTAIAEWIIENKALINAKDILGSTPLHEACRYGNIDSIRLLLESGADPNASDSLGKTPLHLVYENKDKATIYEMLLRYGANPNVKDMYGDTPLHIASINAFDISALEVLTSYNADVNERNKQGNTPLSLAINKENKDHVAFYIRKNADIHAEDISSISPLAKVLSLKSPISLELTKLLITRDTIHSRDSFGNTPLHLACEYKASPEKMQYLLSLTNDVDARNKNGDTALFLAVKKNQRQAGELLIAKKADIFSTNNEHYSPLRIALEAGDERQEWLLNSESIKAKDGVGNTALHYAAEWKLDNAVVSLLEKGANANVQNTNGETALFNAVKSDASTTIALLVSHKADINIRDFLGNTALHASVRYDAKDAAEKLLQLKASIDAKNYAGKTPLSLAARSNRIAMANLLLDSGADVNAFDITGKTILMDAILSGRSEIIGLLLKRGASPVQQEMYGRNAFHEVAETGNPELIALIQEKAGNPLAQDFYGQTPLSIIMHKNPSLIGSILGTNRYLVDTDGNSPLHIALEQNVSTEVLDVLLDMQYPINGRNKFGITPLFIAAERNQGEAAKSLLLRGASIFLSNNEGESPLSMVLARQNSKDLDDILLDIVKYARESRDHAGEAILHYAARLASIETVKGLLATGLNKEIRSNTGEKAYDVAVRWDRLEIAELLR
ncbi:MAG TPA: ankyrin repeat domain-containing protein [Treponemataceae bacterium]|nr:ankyrin repeat domain-containing protein [Treponemataceae bacterium]